MRNLVLATLWFAAFPALASDTIIGGSYAKICAEFARVSAEGGGTAPDAIATCDKAIEGELLVTGDLSATHVNRGVLYLPNAPVSAERDFRAAIALSPISGDTYVDLGAAELAQNRFDNAIADIDKGLSLTLKSPEKAYFDRALAEDDKGDENAAYRDFSTALQLRPGWGQAVQELTRFTVKEK